jgi:hypothetical protein
VPAIFGPGSDLALRLVLYGIGIGGTVGLGLGLILPSTGYETGRDRAPAQLVPFSHQHHVGGLGLDCRYCHGSVEIAANAGMPPSYTCMTCHSQIWTSAPMLAPVRQSMAEDKPLHWRRVYDLPDYVFFDHSIHVAKGVGCSECHGPVDEMRLTYKATSLQMSWCLDCHRDPGPRLRPHDQIFNLHWHRTPDTPAPDVLVAQYGIEVGKLQDCSICHR